MKKKLLAGALALVMALGTAAALKTSSTKNVAIKESKTVAIEIVPCGPGTNDPNPRG